ncbi:MAG: hypothetical protein ABWY28_21275 [Pseudomonas prosekii]|uniref:DUF3077 domain-containing protein n=1 Tax=Pseudomonas prosekii TaxID=1148509 RepID=A0A3L8CF34_9PSED|nr:MULTISPECIES: hypothetical protein [Pseudomonas]RLU06196.1 hypothetical protein CS076_21365 [Pseudomonas prosekii]RLU06792.1 hypothetical protein CS078_20390 [Pseudomonas prosekii]TWD51838.1 hypothetical protein FBY12_0347 [Pseudomonas sp. SJZ131]
MFKVTPNPPHTDPVPYDATFDLDPEKIKVAADRALKIYLNPGATKAQIAPCKPSNIFAIDPAADDETLLVDACDALASASSIVNDLVGLADNPRRQTLLVLQRVITMGELAVNRVLDNHKPG